MNHCQVPSRPAGASPNPPKPPARLPAVSFSRDTGNRVLWVVLLSSGLLNTLLGAILIVLYGDPGE
jgi:hypothetical protein